MLSRGEEGVCRMDDSGVLYKERGKIHSLYLVEPGIRIMKI